MKIERLNIEDQSVAESLSKRVLKNLTKIGEDMNEISDTLASTVTVEQKNLIEMIACNMSASVIALDMLHQTIKENK